VKCSADAGGGVNRLSMLGGGGRERRLIHLTNARAIAAEHHIGVSPRVAIRFGVNENARRVITQDTRRAREKKSRRMTPLMSTTTVAAPASPTLRPVMLFGSSPVMRALQIEIESAARSAAKVLLTGATGAGKEVVARTIHQRSRRVAAPFVTINCAGVPDTLLESEFFGHVRGSFTGAFRDNPGLLRQADRGTVFLDEIGEMSLRMQALLLRFLETGEIQTVGAALTHTRVDVRIIAATNRNLLEAVAAREFREDLYYRLNVLHLTVPQLRERRADIPELIAHYLRHFAEQHQMDVPTLSDRARDLLVEYPWPGNVRELKNVVERLVLAWHVGPIEPASLPAEIVAAATGARPGSSRPTAGHRARIERMLTRVLVQKESFWAAVYPAFMGREITRDDLRSMVRTGLEQTQGSYRLLLALFNMPPQDYKRFLGFLRQHDCHLPFQRFRMLKSRPIAQPGAGRGRATPAEAEAVAS
jgi:transcriptional regulator with PAS, ATPase and Fis domain